MNKINCIIVDDEERAINVIRIHCSKTPTINLLKTFESSVEALQYTKEHSVDLVFLDMQMPDLNGIQFMQLLNPTTKVIVTTAYDRYAVEGYKFSVIDYLIKPIEYVSFFQALEKYFERYPFQNKKINIQEDAEIEKIKKEDRNYLVVASKIKNSQIKIYHEDIIYVESQLNRINIVTDKETINVLQSMKTIEKQLGKKFIRVHNSYIVNVKQVTKIENSKVKILHLGKTFPIGITYRDNINLLFEKKS